MVHDSSISPADSKPPSGNPARRAQANFTAVAYLCFMLLTLKTRKQQSGVIIDFINTVLYCEGRSFVIISEKKQ